MGFGCSLSQAGSAQMTMCSGRLLGEMLVHSLSRKMETGLELSDGHFENSVLPVSSYLFKIFTYASTYY